ncbi:MAG TPA: signal peptide peptidase SppA [Saprospiraceae bacterium]|nr:signal peptide peptidase SppA [Candidatus Parvibacillus calidus]MBX2935821.1 signal peptide peptidase SppA [Saprospiraceae bacterium]MBX7178406.1 signal peptide peptidase SppA [Saprospiraceae bacterium]MCB0591394.1 signal peptide peptidase SppA [Saprospiraceae bacterium]MCO5283681.1 signal peptide peptidase SppA [Saprospiraceae bacterium]
MKSFLKIVLGSCVGVIFAMALFSFLSVIAFSSMSSSLTGGGGKEISPNSVLRISLEQPMPDKTNNIESSPLSFANRTFVGIVDAVKLIKHAKTDENIKGIYINPGPGMAIGSAALKDLHDALLDFKTSKKFVIAYGEALSQGGYYLSSTADDIYLNPVGEVYFKGLGMSIMYFKNLMDKLKIKMNVFYVGKFKSATEPFRSDHMSPENRLQLKTFLNGMFSQMVEDIARNRKLDPAAVKKVADELSIQAPEDALALNFIDKLAYEDEVFEEIKTKLKLKAKDKINFVSLNEYYDGTTLEKDYNAKEKIVLIYAEGEINDSDSHDAVIGGKSYVRYLRKARLDDKVKAVVLRVDSPGGSAYASEQMWHEIDLLKKAGKKVIVSMGNLAASGGYYISCAADRIFANNNTITGSIGVFGMIPNVSGFYNDKLYLTMDSVKTGPNGLGINGYYDMTPAETSLIQRSIESIYKTFTKRVADGRKLSIETVDSLAQGRIYSGKDAVKIGLVDEIGDVEDAIASAASMAKLKEYRLVEYPETKPPFEKFMEKLSGKETDDNAVKAAVTRELKAIAPEYIEVKRLLQNNRIQARLPMTITIN